MQSSEILNIPLSFHEVPFDMLNSKPSNRKYQTETGKLPGSWITFSENVAESRGRPGRATRWKKPGIERSALMDGPPAPITLDSRRIHEGIPLHTLKVIIFTSDEQRHI
jgi:hypothetical protein